MTKMHGFTSKHDATVNKAHRTIPGRATGPTKVGSAADVREDTRDHGADEYREKA